MRTGTNQAESPSKLSIQRYNGLKKGNQGIFSTKRCMVELQTLPQSNEMHVAGHLLITIIFGCLKQHQSTFPLGPPTGWKRNCPLPLFHVSLELQIRYLIWQTYIVRL